MSILNNLYLCVVGFLVETKTKSNDPLEKMNSVEQQVCE